MKVKNLFNLSRGTICVIRQYQGEYVFFSIIPQENYLEWHGCCSII